MKPSAENIPTWSPLWEEICRVNTLRERRIAEQMAAAWKAGPPRMHASISRNPESRSASEENPSPGAGTVQPA